MGGRRYSVSRTITAPAPVVWQLLTDPAGYTRWNRAVVSIEGTMAVGSKIRVVSTVDPKRRFTLRVTAMDPPNQMVWTGGMPLGLFTGRRTYTITERGPDACQFAMVEQFSGPLAGLITRSMPDLTASFDTFADGLTAAAEAEAGPAGR